MATYSEGTGVAVTLLAGRFQNRCFFSRPAPPDFITRLRNSNDPPLTSKATQTACHTNAAAWVQIVSSSAARASIAKGEDSGKAIANISSPEPGWVIV